jgi:hypothetical protein
VTGLKAGFGPKAGYQQWVYLDWVCDELFFSLGSRSLLSIILDEFFCANSGNMSFLER